MFKTFQYYSLVYTLQVTGMILRLLPVLLYFWV